MKAAADVGKTRVIGEVIKINPLTTLIKIDPEGLIGSLRSWFMEHETSMREYRNMMKTLGITRGGYTKRHNIKHRVSFC